MSAPVNKIPSLLILTSLLLTSLSHGGSGHGGSGHGGSGHENPAASYGNWQADIDLTYRQKQGPNLLGYLPTNQHESSAGLRLDHADLGYQREIPGGDQDFKQQGKIALSYHSGNLELAEAWINNQWQKKQLSLLVGQYLPRIGFLNHQHQHAQDFIQSPLINSVYWGDQVSEAGLALQQRAQFGGLHMSQQLNALGGKHLNSKKDTVAALYQLQLGNQPESSHPTAANGFSYALLVNAYYSEVEDRGLFLFDLSNNTHTHNNRGYSEFFDGDIRHLGAGLKLMYNNHYGQWSYQGEYASRKEKGRLYNPTNDLAALQLNSSGNYQQLLWKSPQGKFSTGLRYDYLHSDATVSNTSDNKLDNSRLNNHGQTPQRLTLMTSIQLSELQQLQLQCSDGIDWKAYSSRFEMHFQQSFTF